MPSEAQLEGVIVSLMSVTAPLRARARPYTVTASFIEIDVLARMLPANTDAVPSVAELPICQKTLHGCAPLMRFTRLPEAVVSDEPAWKMKTAVGIVLRVERQRAGQSERRSGVVDAGREGEPAEVPGHRRARGVRPAASS